MKTFNRLLAIVLLGFLGCLTARREYRGPGTLETSRSIIDGIYLDTRYIITLASFSFQQPLSNTFTIEHIPRLGPSQAATVQIEFFSTNHWISDPWVVAQAQKRGWPTRSTSEIDADLSIEVIENSDVPLCSLSGPLTKFTWSGHRVNDGFVTAIYGFRGTMFVPKPHTPYQIKIRYDPRHTFPSEARAKVVIQK
jgi:hypothetical protein